MRIVNLQAENIKRISVVNITPKGDIVEIAGKNSQGKSSILDSLYYALAGTSEIPSQPIRRGEDGAIIKLDLGDIKITRRFSKKEGGYTTTVVVENADGARYPSPQTMLDALVGSLSFDPLTFSRQDAPKQFETLKKLTGLDFSEMEQANKADYDARTAVNRTAKDLRAAAESIIIPDDAPTEPVDESALVEQLAEAGRHNAALEQRKATREAFAAETVKHRERVTEINTQIAQLQEQAARLQEHVKEIESEIAARDRKVAEAAVLPAPVDPSAITAQITAARQTNQIVEMSARKAAFAAKAEEAEKQSAKLTKAMADREAEKLKLIAEAKMPIEGIGFGDGIVTLDGLPFDQASSAEQLRASIAIAAAGNPKLRVIRTKDGALLDADSMKLLEGFAEKHDMQIWCEVLATDRPGAVVIEDGHVKEPADA
jgi:DNA repair exonuclease SbcCD ATPase subunit